MLYANVVRLWTAFLSALVLAACTEHDPELGHVGGAGAVGGLAAGGTGGSSGAGASGGTGGVSGAAGAACVLDTTGMANPSYPCDILAVIGPRTDGKLPKCLRCHTEPQVNGAPFSLLTWPDTQKVYPPVGGKPIWQKMYVAVDTKFMPICAETGCGNFEGGPTEKLTDEERNTLLSWLECPQPVDSPGCD
jgi:hypothetical protein